MLSFGDRVVMERYGGEGRGERRLRERSLRSKNTERYNRKALNEGKGD